VDVLFFLSSRLIFFLEKEGKGERERDKKRKKEKKEIR